MIVPDISEYEETDSNKAKYTIIQLHNEIDRLKKEQEQYSDSDLEIKKGLIDKINRLQARIDKAIEYIDKELSFNVIINGKENKVIAYNKAFENIRNILESSDEQ